MAKLSQKIARIAFGDILSKGIGFVTTIYLARVLGTESYGLIVIALSYLGYATWFADLGLTHIGGREMAKKKSNRVFRAIEVFYLKMILNLIVLTSVQFIVGNINIPDQQKIIILSFSYALIPFTFILEWYYNGRQHFGKVASSKTVNSFVYLVLVVLFVHSPLDIEKVPLFFIVGSSASALLYGYFSYKEKPFVLPFRGFSFLKDLFRSALTIGSGNFFTQMIQLFPPILIGIFLTEEDAGIYGAAIRIIFAAMLFDRIFVNLLLPNLSAQWIENIQAAKKNIKFVSKIMLAFGAVLSLSIAIASPVLTEILFGKEYIESGNILPFLAILLFFTFQNSLFGFGLIAIGKDKQFFSSTLLSGVISGVLIFLAASSKSLVFIVISVSVSEVIFTLSAFYWFRKSVNVDFIQKALITVILSFGLYYLSIKINAYPVIEALIAIGILIPLLITFRVIGLEHLIWLKQKLIP